MRGFDQFAEIQPCLESGPLEHVDDIFSGDIAGGSWGEGATAYAAAAGINDIHTSLNGGRDIGKTGAARVVKMQS